MIVGAVNGHPRLHSLKRPKDTPAVDHQIPHDWEFRHRLELNFFWIFLEQLVDQSRARHARASVDEHRAGTAHFLKAIAIPRHRRNVPTVL